MKKLIRSVSALLCAALLFSTGCTRPGTDETEKETTHSTGASPLTEEIPDPEPVPGFSADGGFYAEGFSLSLTPPANAADGAYITYTTDGSEPGADSARYSSEIDINGTVSVRVHQHVLTVRDTGIGIPKAHQARIFERFYRVDKSRSKATGGTGLGLAIVRQICEQHHAEIRLESREGVGTEISVTFPTFHED